MHIVLVALFTVSESRHHIMSLTLIRDPVNVFWTTSPPNGRQYRLLSIIVSNTKQLLAAYETTDSAIVEVVSATPNGGTEYTTAFEAAEDTTTCIIFPRFSRYTLQGDTAPGHTAFYCGYGGLIQLITPGGIYNYLTTHSVVDADIRSAPTSGNGSSVTEQYLSAEDPLQSKVTVRPITSFDKRQIVPGSATSIVYHVDQGVPYVVYSGVTNVPESGVAVGSQIGQNIPATAYVVPENQVIQHGIIKYCWPPEAPGTEWVVTGVGARSALINMVSITSSPTTDNAYMCLYGGSLADNNTAIPMDNGTPVTTTSPDGFIIGGAASGYVSIASNQTKPIWPFLSFPSDIATINPTFQNVIDNGVANEVSYVQLIPMKQVVPAVFTSSDSLFGPYVASIATMTVGTDVYDYDAEAGGFVLDFTNDSTRSMVSATNMTFTASIQVPDTGSLLKSVTVNGSSTPFSDITVVLTNVAQVVFAGKTKASGGGGGSSTAGIIIGGIALFIIIALIIAGIVVATRQ